MTILYIYSAGEYPPRKTVEAFINCFKKYSQHEVFYWNISVARLPLAYRLINFDLVIFSHFMTTPWNRKTYLSRLKYLKHLRLSRAYRVAFFQDEYFNTDLSVRFINELGIQTVYSVAPQSEWPKIYQGVSPQVRIRSYLTGYVEIDDTKNLAQISYLDKTIEIGYRTGWPEKEMYRLGIWGTLKYKVADEFLKHKDQLNLDIEVGRNFYRGSSWFEFLSKCKYTIGVESGASLHDRDGQITAKINRYLEGHPKANFVEVKANCFAQEDGNLRLRALSPRIFEAAMSKTALVLIDGDYSHTIIPWRHYIPLKEDFSNINEVIEFIKRDDLRADLVANCYSDLISSGKYTFKRFTEEFFADIEPLISLKPSSVWTPLYRVASSLTDSWSWFLLFLWSRAVAPALGRLGFIKQ